MASPAPLRVLSLDGGGIRGISSLLILEKVMEQIRDAEGLDHVPRPCDRFDLIGGTSTGGIIAIMLGRLGMTIDECIRAYKNVARQAFTPKRTTILAASPAGAFSAKALEAAIKRTVKEFCVESGCVTRRRQGQPTTETCPHGEALFRSTSCTKTIVLAITKNNVDTLPTLFDTHDTSTGLAGCTIWQVARATSAATTFFKPIKVGRDEIEFVDAGFGYNNPCEVLIDEAQRQFPGRGQMQVLSIGTGLGDVVDIGKTRLSIISALKKMATSSKRVATTLHNRDRDSNWYYRFNVEQGLQDVTLSDWEKSSTISAHTHNYLSENKWKIKTFVDIFVSIDQGGATTDSRELPSDATGTGTEARQMPAELGRSASRHYIPFDKNERFVGRETQLDQLKAMFDQRRRKVALVGLGGVGKTQVALQIAYWVKERKKEHSVFWLPALSDGSFEQACSEIVSALGIPTAADDNDARKALRRYLSSDAAGKWLLVVDNADDLTLLFGTPEAPGGMDQFLPKSPDGVTLFTTRSNDVAVSVAKTDVVELGEMNPKEANEFLTKSVAPKSLLRDKVATVELLEKLTYLPLAITQAAAYLSIKKMPVAEYLELLDATEADAIGLMSEEFRDDTRYEGSQNAVATTWFVSFQQIRNSDPAVAELLSFVSCIEAKGIPQSLLPQCGSAQKLASAIGTLCAYAFLARRGDSKVFDMHRLVQLAARNQLRQAGVEAQEMRKAVRHMQEVFPNDDYENRDRWREYLPHAFRLLSRDNGDDMEERYRLSFWVGRCLREDGRIKEAVRYLEETCHWRGSQFPEEHPSRLASQHALAGAYQADGQVEKAVELLERVIVVHKRTLAEEHPSRLASQHELARAYEADGQVDKAVELLEHVVAVKGRTLTEEHPSRLASQHALAGAYQADGQVKKAVELLERVIVVEERTLAEEHPSRLASQHELARAYEADGQVDKAVELLEHVVAVKGRTLTEEHPSRLASQHELAGAYQADGQVKKAVELLERVVAVHKRTLAEEHPSRLASQHALAGAYQADGQVEKAVELLERVVLVRERTLTEEHPSRLASQHTLARAYEADGQVEKAVELLERVVSVRERTLTEEHPSRLASQHALAGAYQADGQVEKAVELLERVIVVEERTLAEEHPDRLASQYALAGAYQADGQVKKAVELLERVIVVHKRTLAEEHPSRLASQHELAGAYQADGQVKKAVELLEHVVAVHKRTLTEEHPSRLASQHTLAGAYQADGQVERAVELLEHVVAVHKRTLTEEHPSRLASQHTLAGAYQADGQVKKAVELLEHVVAVRERTLAEEHPSRLASQHELARAYEADGQVDKAVELLEHVVAVKGRTLTEEHPSRLASQHALAGAYEADGQVDKAVELLAGGR